jgi:hypothetical protein
VRQETWLLQAFPTFPGVELPAQTAAKAPRIFELRIYESPSEKAHLKKVEMFEKLGEIAIFKRTGLVPVFFARMIAGPRMPCLTYMLVQASLAARRTGRSPPIPSGARSRRRRASATRTSSRTSPLAAATVGGVADQATHSHATVPSSRCAGGCARRPLGRTCRRRHRRQAIARPWIC